jgi:hypothetical protein
MNLAQEIADDVCTILFGPEVLHVARPVHLAVRLSAEHARDTAASHAFFRDARGTETERRPLGPAADRTQPGTLETEAITLAAPDTAVIAGWSAVLFHHDPQGAESVDSVVSFDLSFTAHPVAVTVWDVPSAVQTGGNFAISVGLKCTCGCPSVGWGFAVLDAEGSELARGQVGAAPALGTSGLCHASLTLTAPATPGQQVWQVAALPPPDLALPHACGTIPLRVDARPAPEVTLRIEAFDAETGAPVDRAKVVVHPYRTLTGPDGVAELRVPKGEYRIYVSGKSYFATQTQRQVDNDQTIRAALYIDREFTDADQWA